MNDTLKVLGDKKKPPQFQNTDMIPEETLEQIVKSRNLCAKSGMGKQSPIILAVTNKELRDQLSEENRKNHGSTGKEWIRSMEHRSFLWYLAKSKVPTHVYDGSLVMGNLMNAAEKPRRWQASLWIHRAKEGVRISISAKNSC